MAQSTPNNNPSEFTLSAIPAAYAKIAVQHQGQRLLVEALVAPSLKGRNGHGEKLDYLGREDAALMRRYEEAAEQGGWIASQATMTGLLKQPSDYIKLATPRVGIDGRAVKYETPARTEATPLLPPFTWEMGRATLERHCSKKLQAAYAARFKALAGGNSQHIDKGWWDFVEGDRGIPIVIGEGWKKVLSTSARTYPTVGVRGVRTFFKKKLSHEELGVPHEVLGRLCRSGRKVTLCFDQDAKLKTQLEVTKALSNIATALEKVGCKVFVAGWDNIKGKGVDDVLYKIQSQQGSEAAQAWLDATMSAAPAFKAWRRGKQVASNLHRLGVLNTNSHQGRFTEGEYLPQLPALEQGAIHVLNAPMNSGKTVRIGADWVQTARAAGWNILVLSPLNTLGVQTAKNWDFPHIHDYGFLPGEQEALYAEISSRGGVVMCPDSLHRLPDYFWYKGKVEDGVPRPVLLVLDEANQVINHMVDGSTLGHRFGDIIELFSAIANHSLRFGAVVLSEAGIPDRAINFVKAVAGVSAPVRGFTHKKQQQQPWDVTVLKGALGGFRTAIISQLSQETPLLFVCSSQAEGEKLEYEVGNRYPHKKVVRIDGDTNQPIEDENGNTGENPFTPFFENPDAWLAEHRPDLLILSPSAKSGVSIQGGVSVEEAYFRSVWGCFTSLDTDTHLQMLGRYRPSVPRFIYCPPFIQSSSDETLGIKGNSRHLQLAQVLEQQLDLAADTFERGERRINIEAAVQNYHAQSSEVAGLQKAIAVEALTLRLEAAGHQCQVVAAKGDKAINESYKRTQDVLWGIEATEQAVAPGLGTWDKKRKATRDAAYIEENKGSGASATKADRLAIKKCISQLEFPDAIDFDNPEEVKIAFVDRYGRMASGVKAQAGAESPQLVKAAEGLEAGAILRASLRALHRLPKAFVKSSLLNASGILELLDGSQYSNTDPRCLSIKENVLKFSEQFSYFLGVNAKGDDSPVDICHRLLVRFGLEASTKSRLGAIERLGRPGKRGEKRDYLYQCDPAYHPIRVKLLEAYRRKLSEATFDSVSIKSINKESTIDFIDTNYNEILNPPVDKELGGVALMLRDFAEEGSLDKAAMVALTDHLTPPEKREIWESLPLSTRNKLLQLA